MKHFEKKGEKSSTVYSYLKNEPTANSSSRTPFKAKNKTDTQTGNQTGRVVKVTRTFAQKPRVLVPIQKANFRNKSEKLLSNCRQRCGTLYAKYKGFNFVLDNICSFTYMSNQGSKYRHYYAHENDTRPPPVIYESDLVPRLDVWIAISNKGISEPFICSTNDLTTRDFSDECVGNILIPFIKENHDLEETVLWSDANKFGSKKSVCNILENEGIQFVDKEDNPGNRVRCFSYFWTMLKDQVYRGNWIAADCYALEKRIRACLKRINIQDVIQLVNDTEERIVEMYRTGVIDQYSNEKKNYTKSNSIY